MKPIALAGVLQRGTSVTSIWLAPTRIEKKGQSQCTALRCAWKNLRQGIIGKEARESGVLRAAVSESCPVGYGTRNGQGCYKHPLAPLPPPVSLNTPGNAANRSKAPPMFQHGYDPRPASLYFSKF